MSALIDHALAAHKAGYEVVACHGKAPVFQRWQNTDTTPDIIRAWEGDGRVTNIGIRCGSIIGVDIDVYDAPKAERIKNLALRMLGDTSLVRLGQNPKQLLVYRVAVPIRKKIITGEINPTIGKSHKVEVLASGQQFVAYGKHPDTLQHYAWPETDLTAVAATSVPVATEEALDAFLQAAQGIIGRPPGPVPAASPAPARGNGYAHEEPDKADVLNALYSIPGDLEYDEWIKVGFALYAALGASGAEHWAQWSARSAKNVPATTAYKWPSFARNDAIHAETLFYVARYHGWKPEQERQDISRLGLFKTRQERAREEGADPETGEFPSAPVLSFTPYTWLDPATIPQRRFLYGRHYIRQFLSTDISPGGVGKSSLAIADAVAMAAHKDLLGTLPTERCRVAYWNGEDPLEELQRRVQAVCLHYGITAGDIAGRLFVDSGRLLPLIVAKENRQGVTLDHAVIDAIIASIQAHGIDALIIDPFIASHRVSENDNNAIELVAKVWSHIADVTNCAVNLVHHSRKTNGEEVTVEAGRGASALLAACRSARTLNQMTENEAERSGVKNRRLYFRVDDGKANLQPPTEQATWYRIANVDLPNGPMGTTGDKVGVVTGWTMPDALGTLNSKDLRAVQNAIGAGKWRENVQARDWVGIAIAKALGLTLPGDKSRVKSLVRIWLDNGALVRIAGVDQHREERTYVEVGNWVEPDA